LLFVWRDHLSDRRRNGSSCHTHWVLRCLRVRVEGSAPESWRHGLSAWRAGHRRRRPQDVVWDHSKWKTDLQQTGDWQVSQQCRDCCDRKERSWSNEVVCNRSTSPSRGVDCLVTDSVKIHIFHVLSLSLLLFFIHWSPLAVVRRQSFQDLLWKWASVYFCYCSVGIFITKCMIYIIFNISFSNC